MDGVTRRSLKPTGSPRLYSRTRGNTTEGENYDRRPVIEWKQRWTCQLTLSLETASASTLRRVANQPANSTKPRANPMRTCRVQRSCGSSLDAGVGTARGSIIPDSFVAAGAAFSTPLEEKEFGIASQRLKNKKTFGGGFSPTAVLKLRRLARKVARGSVDRTAYSPKYSLSFMSHHAERISLSVVRGVNRAIRSHLATLSARLARA